MLTTTTTMNASNRTARHATGFPVRVIACVGVLALAGAALGAPPVTSGAGSKVDAAGSTRADHAQIAPADSGLRSAALGESIEADGYADAINGPSGSGLGNTDADSEQDDTNLMPFDLFLDAFIEGDMAADINGDGFVNGDDFDAYMWQVVAP